MGGQFFRPPFLYAAKKRFVHCRAACFPTTIPLLKKRKRQADRAAKSPGNSAPVIQLRGNFPASGTQPALRRWLFRLLASVVVPLLLLGVLEVTLRVAGFGHRTSFFVPRQVQGEKVLVENPALDLASFPRH